VQNDPVCLMQNSKVRSSPAGHSLSSCWLSMQSTMEFRTSEIRSAGFSGTMQQTLVQQSLDLPDLFHCPWCGSASSVKQLKHLSCQWTAQPTRTYSELYIHVWVCVFAEQYFDIWLHVIQACLWTTKLPNHLRTV